MQGVWLPFCSTKLNSFDCVLATENLWSISRSIFSTFCQMQAETCFMCTFVYAASFSFYVVLVILGVSWDTPRISSIDPFSWVFVLDSWDCSLLWAKSHCSMHLSGCHSTHICWFKHLGIAKRLLTICCLVGSDGFATGRIWSAQTFCEGFAWWMTQWNEFSFLVQKPF